MKRSRIKPKPSKWDRIRPALKREFLGRDITECELRLPGCWRNNALGFAHRHKRQWYLDKPELLGAFDQVVLACVSCHEKIEDDKVETERQFLRLRA